MVLVVMGVDEMVDSGDPGLVHHGLDPGTAAVGL
jgi:hypothetical protein